MAERKLGLDNQDNDYVQNFIMRDKLTTKVPGTNRYNHEYLVNKINWVERFYGLNADGSKVKRTLCHSNGIIYLGDDVAGAFTSIKTGLTKNTLPESVIIQVAQQSRLYFFNGYDTPIHYNGNAAGTFNPSAITYKFQGGVSKDQRLWGFERNSSKMWYSPSGEPEDIADYGFVTCGNEKDSFIRNAVVLGNYVYVFKNDSIWVIRGNTSATYRPEELVPNTGLLAQRAVARVGSAIVFVSQQDKQIYEYGGSWKITPLTGIKMNYDFSSLIDYTQTDVMCCIWDRINSLFRVSYKAIEVDENYANYELIAPTDDIGKDKQWKWTNTYGARISCYSMWDRQGDATLVTGRSDTGAIMYHNRGSDWDVEPMETILRTDDITGKDGWNTLFQNIFLKGTPSNGTITMRSYLNSRMTGESTRSSQTFDDTGESETAIGEIEFRTQVDFNDYNPLLTGYNYGERIAFEFYDNTKGKEVELEFIIIEYMVKSKVKNKLVG